MPKDPRDAVGRCGNTDPWNPPLQPWQTGGAGAGATPATVPSWPPQSLNNGGPVSLLPSYAPTGTLVTLPAPTFTHSSGSTATATIDAGSGWANPSDSGGLYVPVSTCSYLDPWVGPTAAPPSPLCSGSGARRRHEHRQPAITPAHTV